MLIPISWLKDFVDIKLPLKELMWRMTEAGLTCEAYKKVGDDIVLDVEVTANRPDWMSIVGVAREVAAIQGIKIKEPKEEKLPARSANFPIDLVTNFELFERWSAIIIKGVDIKPSPDWLAERIRLMGHAPINNIIDITNYAMYELGLPMHAFDYDEISGQIMTVARSSGGEDFTTVDELSYKLPKNAMIIKDSERIIDLVGIKGGLNSGIKPSTKNILLHVTIDNPVLIRRASLALGLRSDASAIYERGPDKGATVKALKRATALILKLAGGAIASEIIDLRKSNFLPWKLTLTPEKLDKVLGISINPKDVINILSKLNLYPIKSGKNIVCTIPTYRGDLKIEEDLIEEVARIYGYNRFTKTIPEGRVAEKQIPYYFDDSFHLNLKHILNASGYSEAITLSLLSKSTLDKFRVESKGLAKITNPVSLEYEYMRPTLIPGLVCAVKINSVSPLKLFEIDKVYPSENYKLAGIATGVTFRQFKGAIDAIFDKLGIAEYKIDFETDKKYLHPFRSASISIGKEVVGEFGEMSPSVLNELAIRGNLFCFEFEVPSLKKHSKTGTYKNVPENPPQIEDITLSFPPKTRIGLVTELIKSIDKIISNVELTDTYKDNFTFRIWYQDSKKNLSDQEVEVIRSKILTSVKSKFGGTLRS